MTDPSGALAGCATAQANPKDKSRQASGDGPSDADSSLTAAGGANPPQQNGCVSRTNDPDWFDAVGSESFEFGGGDDSGELPSGLFQIGQGSPGQPLIFTGLLSASIQVTEEKLGENSSSYIVDSETGQKTLVSQGNITFTISSGLLVASDPSQYAVPSLLYSRRVISRAILLFFFGRKAVLDDANISGSLRLGSKAFG